MYYTSNKYFLSSQIHERKIAVSQVLNVGSETHLVTASEDQTLCVWRVRTGALVGQCALVARPTSLQLLRTYARPLGRTNAAVFSSEMIAVALQFIAFLVVISGIRYTRMYSRIWRFHDSSFFLHFLFAYSFLKDLFFVFTEILIITY